MPKKFDIPKVEHKTQTEIEAIIDALNASNLTDSVKIFAINCIRLACWFPTLLEKKNISIRRLQEMIFGKKKKKPSSGNDDDNNNSSSHSSSNQSHSGDGDNQADSSSGASNKKDAKPNGKNNGRNPHTVYKEANIEWHTLDDVISGSACPQDLCTGKLYPQPAGIIVCIDGQAMAKVTKHFVEKYRCNLCSYTLAANVPKELEGKQKVYTPAFKAHLAMHKFYLAVPYHRMECYHQILHCPLPDSTQWGLIESLASSCYPLFDLLKCLAANGKLIYNDDTVVRILEVMADNKKREHSRTGMYTTCIMAEDHEGHKIALYFNGTQHSGENVDALLQERETDKPRIIQMSDALAVNTPATIATIACYCLSHGFRKFEELYDYFPHQCISLMEKLGKVFALDAKTVDMTDDERLAYHKAHSADIMFALYVEICGLLESNDVEPNGELAKALRYFIRHWVELTRFLSVPGAPINNNIVERALKLAIRVRNNSLFYKTTYSAALSGMLTSLIYTCTYANVNPVDYLTALQVHQRSVLTHPEKWLPWNFHDEMKKVTLHVSTHATAQVVGPPLGSLAVTQSVTDPPTS